MEFFAEEKKQDLSVNIDENTQRHLSAREKNELTAKLIKKQIGDLEQIRLHMGLNKKRMCELLLLDPSTWTRWTTGKTEPPPWLYRTLQWGLAVMEKHPEFHPLMIRQDGDSKARESLMGLEKNNQKLFKELFDLRRKLKFYGYALLCVLSGSLLILTITFIFRRL